MAVGSPPLCFNSEICKLSILQCHNLQHCQSVTWNFIGETSFCYNSLLSSEPRSPKNRKSLPVKTYGIILGPGIILICTVICCINCRAAGTGTMEFLATCRATVGQWTVIQQDGKTIHGYSRQQNSSWIFEMLLPCAYGSCQNFKMSKTSYASLKHSYKVNKGLSGRKHLNSSMQCPR